MEKGQVAELCCIVDNSIRACFVSRVNARWIARRIREVVLHARLPSMQFNQSIKDVKSCVPGAFKENERGRFVELKLPNRAAFSDVF